MTPPAASIERNQRLDVPGLQPGLDDDVAEPHRELRVAVQVAAVAREACAVGHRGERRGLARRAEVARIGGDDDRVLVPRALARGERAPLAAAPPLRPCRRVRDERLADEGLVGHADDGTRAVVQRDQHAPVQLPDDEAARAVDRIDDPRPRLASRLVAVLLAVACRASGYARRDRRADRRLGGAVGDGHRIVAADAILVLDVDRATEVRQDRLARVDGGRGTRTRGSSVEVGHCIKP